MYINENVVQKELVDEWCYDRKLLCNDVEVPNVLRGSTYVPTSNAIPMQLVSTEDDLITVID